MKRLLIIAGAIFLLVPAIASSATPPLTVPQGGTGSSTLTGILYGNSTSAVRSVSVGSGLIFSGGTLSASGGGTGNVATSSSETAGYIPYWTSTNGTPATLGADSYFDWDSAGHRLGLGYLSPPSRLSIGGAFPQITVGDGMNLEPSIFFDYPGISGGDFTGKMAGVSQLSFGFNNLAAFGGSSGADDGRTVYFYDRIASLYRGALNGDGTWFLGDSPTRYSLKAERPNSGVTALNLKADGTATFSSLTNGLVKSTSGSLANATAGTDYTLITAKTCTSGDFVSSVTAAGVFTCTTPTTGGTGTVTSVDLTVPTGLSVSGNPVTTSGTLALSLAAGYNIPKTASTTDWNTAYLNRITSLTTTGTSGAATLTGNTLNIPQYAGNTYTAGAGLTLTTGAFSVNTSQNIAKLSNLTGNGFVKTSGGDGTLSVASLAALTATDSTLTFSGSYDGSTARTVGLNLSNANTWTGQQTFNTSAPIFGTITGSTQCLHVNSAGLVSGAGSDCGSGGGGAPGGSGTELQYRSGASTFGAIGGSAFNTFGYVGLGSTTPWANLSIASSTISDYTRPLFAIATSTDVFGQLVTVHATTSSTVGTAGGGLFSTIDNGVRVVIGAFRSTLVQLFINGRYASSWSNNFCDSFNVQVVSVSANSNFICGFISFNEGTDATFNTITTGELTGGQLSVTSSTVVDRARLVVSSPFSAAALGSTTPIMEVITGPLSVVSSTTGATIGWTTSTSNVVGSNSCSIMATSTANWQYLCNNGTATQLDTGVATSTPLVKWHLEFTPARFTVWYKTSLYNKYTRLADITTSIPTTGTMFPTVMVARTANGNAITPTLSVYGIRYWQLSTWNAFDD